MKPYKLPKDYLEYSTFEKHRQLFTLITPQPLDVSGTPHVSNNLSYLYNQWTKDYPLYCVRRNLLEAMLQTDVGEKLELFADINLSIPFYNLFLPKSTIRSPTGAYIIVNQYELDLPEHKYAIVWGGVDSKDNLILSSKRIRRDGTLQTSLFTTDDEDVISNTYTIRNIVLQSILLLQYYPEMAQQMQKLSQSNKGFSKVDTVESSYRFPRWLGKEKKSYIEGNSTKTGNKKSAHFRRGFYRQQPYGEGRTKRKVTWINPTWVNKEDD